MSSDQAAGKGWSSRQAAIDLVIRADGCGSLDSAFADSESFDRLSGRDRAFARAMTGAALRGRGRLDEVIGEVSSRPCDRIDLPVLACLRIGAAQLFMLDTAVHAAVSATVEAARRNGSTRRQAGFVNAVLRRLSESPKLFSSQDDLSVWPQWMADLLVNDLGKRRAEAMARLHLEPPDIDLTVREHPRVWAQRTEGRFIPPAGVRLLPSVAGSLTDLAGYTQGVWWVQNAAAALAVRLFGDVTGKRVCDLCAAPGGKTLQLAAAGADVTAVDISDKRLDRLRQSLERTGLSAHMVCSDAGDWRPDRLFAAILLDAPCSGLGVVRRHPEGIWRHERQSAGYVRQSRQLLMAAHEMLEEDGLVVYCVCTPTAAEGREQIDAVVGSRRWQRVPIDASEVPGFGYAVTGAGDVLTVPPAEYPCDVLTGDVFFISRLRKLSG